MEALSPNRNWMWCPACGRLPIIPDGVLQLKTKGGLKIKCICGRGIWIKRRDKELEDNGSAV